MKAKRSSFDKLVEALTKSGPKAEPLTLRLQHIRLKPDKEREERLWRKIDASIRAREEARKISWVIVCPLPVG